MLIKLSLTTPLTLFQKKEKFLLSLGLDFSLPVSKPSYTKFFLSFEKLAHFLATSYGHNNNFNSFKKECSNLAYKTFSGHWGKNWYPFLKKEDKFILLKTSHTLSKLIRVVREIIR